MTDKFNPSFNTERINARANKDFPAPTPPCKQITSPPRITVSAKIFAIWPVCDGFRARIIATTDEDVVPSFPSFLHADPDATARFPAPLRKQNPFPPIRLVFVAFKVVLATRYRCCRCVRISISISVVVVVVDIEIVVGLLVPPAAVVARTPRAAFVAMIVLVLVLEIVVVPLQWWWWWCLSLATTKSKRERVLSFFLNELPL